MLADPTGALSRAFGVMIEEEGMAYRGTFLVNPEGKIKIAEIHDNGIGRNADDCFVKLKLPVRCFSPERSLSCKVEKRRSNLEAEHRLGW